MKAEIMDTILYRQRRIIEMMVKEASKGEPIADKLGRLAKIIDYAEDTIDDIEYQLKEDSQYKLNMDELQLLEHRYRREMNEPRSMELRCENCGNLIKYTVVHDGLGFDKSDDFRIFCSKCNDMDGYRCPPYYQNSKILSIEGGHGWDEQLAREKRGENGIEQ